MPEFTYVCKGTDSQIVTPMTVDVSDYPTKGGGVKRKERLNALWDTGATVTVISSQLVREFGLTPRGITKVSGFDGKPVMANTYRIDIQLGDNLTIEYIDAIEAPLVTSDILLGLNVIGLDDFHLTHPTYKNTVLTFVLN